jgi:hypothetical protein
VQQQTGLRENKNEQPNHAQQPHQQNGKDKRQQQAG